MGFGERLRLTSPARRSSTRSAGSPIPKPVTTCAASATSGCGQTPLQWPVPRPDGDDDRHPIRYLNDGVSQDLFVDADGHRPRLAFPTPSRRAVFHPRPHMDARELPDDDYPDGAEHRPAAAPVAHHDQDRQGRQAQQARQRTVRRDPSRSTPPRSTSSTASRVELTSRRGRAVLPAVVTDRVRPGNCFVPFHWNDEHGEYLTINALTNDAVDPDSLQPEFKVCAVSLRPPVEVGRTPAPTNSASSDASRRSTTTKRSISQASSADSPEGVSGVPVLPAVGAGRARTSGCGSTACSPAGIPRIAAAPADSPPRTGRWCCGRRRPATPRSSPPSWPSRLDGSRLVNMDDCRWRSWPAPATC